MKFFVAAVVSVTLAVGYPVEAQEKTAPLSSRGAPTRVTSNASLPRVFASVLPEVKARTHLPILLPSKLPKSIGNPQHALIQKAAADEYGISVYYELDAGDAGFEAFFAAQSNPKYNPRELPNIHEVRLTHGIRGFFRSVSCGGSCAPANLWWEEGGVLYPNSVKASLAQRAESEKDHDGGCQFVHSRRPTLKNDLSFSTSGSLDP